MVGIQENHAPWTYWDEYVQYLIDKNKTVQQIRENLKKERSRKLKRIKDSMETKR